MIRLPLPTERRRRESTIALINIVFLMLIFFLIAGTLAPPLDASVSLITTEDAQPTPPPDALYAAADGTLRARGAPTSAEAYLRSQAAAGDPDVGFVRLAADRDLPATRLIEIVAELRAAGAASVRIVTERAKP